MALLSLLHRHVTDDVCVQGTGVLHQITVALFGHLV